MAEDPWYCYHESSVVSDYELLPFPRRKPAGAKLDRSTEQQERPDATWQHLAKRLQMFQERLWQHQYPYKCFGLGTVLSPAFGCTDITYLVEHVGKRMRQRF